MHLGRRLRDMLERLDEVGIYPEDRLSVSTMVRAVLEDPGDLDRVRHLCETVLLPPLRSPAAEGAEFSVEDEQHRLGAGVLPMVALLATAPDVVDRLIERGAPEPDARRIVHDLGQQVMKHRRVTGVTGLHNQEWLRGVWSGRFLWVGRLQFEVTRSSLGRTDGTTARVLSVHIPMTGPLRPSDVDDSLRRAPGAFAWAVSEEGPIEAVVCHSWLLDQHLAGRLPGSNFADFAHRWRVWRTLPRDRDGYYFGFDVEPDPNRALPYAVDDLPTDTRLRAAVVQLWRSGGHVMLARGWIPLGEVRA